MPDRVTGRSSPAKAPRTRLAPELRREQLLDVAMTLFEHRAYDAVTLEGIAEAAGVSPGLVHHYFGTKREVFLGVVARAISGFQQAVAPPLGPGLRPGCRHGSGCGRLMPGMTR
jgi:AcrR family transcriptional regulator